MRGVKRVVIIGAGFAGVSTAAALAGRGVARGVVLEREAVPGAHASGKNAGIARHVEFDPVVRELAVLSLALWAGRRHDGRRLIAPTGGLYLARASRRPRLVELESALGRDGICATVLDRDAIVERWPYLAGVTLDVGVWCPADGVADIHAMLLWCIERARAGGFALRTRTPVESLVVEEGRVAGVRTPGGVIPADVVVDATGAWAGRLGAAPPGSSPPPAAPSCSPTARQAPPPTRENDPHEAPRAPWLVPVRRHLFTTSRPASWPADAPVVWHLDEGFYARPEATGLLCSPCDESPQAPGDPVFDPAAEELLAETLTRHGGMLGSVAVHRGWPCLRTFAPDHRPVVGWDPQVEGLFHVSGLGGFGMTASAAIGEAAAAMLMGDPVDADLARAVAPGRLVARGG